MYFMCGWPLQPEANCPGYPNDKIDTKVQIKTVNMPSTDVLLRSVHKFSYGIVILPVYFLSAASSAPSLSRRVKLPSKWKLYAMVPCSDSGELHTSPVSHPFPSMSYTFFIKSIKSSPKPDALASEAFFLARIASRPLCFLVFALFLLLEFVEGAAPVFGLASFACARVETPVPKEDFRRDDPVLRRGAGGGVLKRVTLLQDSHLYTIALLGVCTSLF
jgi:hypothetical protein